MDYDEYMDTECIALCDALNELEGVETFESCCGHFKNKFKVFLKCTDLSSMAIIARVFDRRYYNGVVFWKVGLDTLDGESNPQFCISLVSDMPYSNAYEMGMDLYNIISNLHYWSQPQYKEYFNPNKKLDLI